MADSASTGYKYPSQIANEGARTPHWYNGSKVLNNPVGSAAEGGTPDANHADVDLAKSQESDGLVASKYGNNINKNARIDGIIAQIVRHGAKTRDEWVAIKYNGNSLNNKAKHRSRTDFNYVVDTYGGATDKWGASVLTPAKINADDFGIVEAIKNIGTGSVQGSIHSMGINVYYTDPTYSLNAVLTTVQTVGKNIVYKLTLKNTNSIHQGYSIPVSLTIPAGLAYVSSSGNGSYNSSTTKWNAVLSNGTATLTLTLQSTTIGAKTITASVDGFSTTLSQSSTIIAPKYALVSNLPTQATQGDTVTYAITLTSDSPTQTVDTFNLTIPDGLAFVSSSGGGSFDSSTGVWTASFTNQKATKTFTFTAMSGGEYQQILTGPDGSSLNRTILIISTGDTDCFYTLHKIPDYIRALMADGKVYTISCYSKISDSSLTSIYPGKDNFKIAAVQAIKNFVYANVATGTNAAGTITGAVGSGATITSSTDWAAIGTKSLKIQTNGNAAWEGYYIPASIRKTCTPGKTYTGRICLKGASGTVRGYLRFFNSDNQNIAQNYVTFTLDGTKQEKDISYVAPSNAVTVELVPLTPTTQSIICYMGYSIIVEGTSIPDGEMDLITGDISPQEEVGTRVDTLDDIQRVYVSFEYDENRVPSVKIYGQYINRSPSTSTIRFFGFALHIGTDINYEDPGILFDTPDYLLQNENYATAIIPSNKGTNPLLFDSINFAGNENDGNLIVKGVTITFDYYTTSDIEATATLLVGDEVRIKSKILKSDSISAEIGGSRDKWNLKNIDLNELSFLLQFDNNTIDTQTIQVTNIQITIDYQYDETGGNLGAILDGEHTRNVNMFFTKDFDISEGLAKDIDTLDIKKSNGVLITGVSNKEKTIKVPFRIVGSSIEELQERFAEAVKWMSNDLDDGRQPIPKPLVFDWDPDREWMVVLNDAVDKKYDIGKMEGTAEFLIPTGSAKGPLRSPGDVDSNNGLTTVKPLITIKATGEDSIVVKEAYSGKNLILNHAWDEEFILYIDCERNRIYDDYGVDCTHYLALNSDLIFLDPGPFDFSQSTGCVVLSVQFNEGL